MTISVMTKFKAVLVAVALALMVPVATTSAVSAKTCQAVRGTLVEYLDATGSYGTMSGDLNGDYKFTLHSLTPREGSDWAYFTGTETITTAEGTITAYDEGWLNTATDEVWWMARITSGTGSYTGATGRIGYGGTLDLESGYGTSDYYGQVCK